MLSLVALATAVYGAILSTLNYWRDRADVRVTFSEDMVEFSGDPNYSDRVFTDVHITNQGKRPTTIMSVGYCSARGDLVLLDTVTDIPAELAEGKFLCAVIDQAKLDLEDVAYFFACDTGNRTFKSISPRFKRKARRLLKKVGVRF